MPAGTISRWAPRGCPWRRRTRPSWGGAWGPGPAGAAPYCRVKGGRFAARLSRAATYQLLRMMEPDEATGQATLVLGGRRLVIPSAGGP